MGQIRAFCISKGTLVSIVALVAVGSSPESFAKVYPSGNKEAKIGLFCRLGAFTFLRREPGAVVPVELGSGAGSQRYLPFNYPETNSFAFEKSTLGYSPNFEAGLTHITPNGRPLIRDEELNLQFLTNRGNWEKIDLKRVLDAYARDVYKRPAGFQPLPGQRSSFKSGSTAEQRIVMDSDCTLYTLVDASTSNISDHYLLYSRDGGANWGVMAIGGRYGFFSDPYTPTMEGPSGTGFLKGPPIVVSHPSYYATRKVGPSDVVFGDMRLYTFRWQGTELVKDFDGSAGELISRQSMWNSWHSGNGNIMASHGDLISFVYQIPSTKFKGVEHKSTVFLGRLFSRSQNKFVSEEFYVGKSAHTRYTETRKPNYIFNPHDQSSLHIDRFGDVHLLINSHNGEIIYMKGTEMGSIRGGLLEVEKIGTEYWAYGQGYTYASGAFDWQGNFHVVARLADELDRYHLAYLLKMKNEPKFRAKKLLISPSRGRYGKYHHKLTMDFWNRVWISYSYFPGHLVAAERDQYEYQFGVRMTECDRTTAVVCPIEQYEANPRRRDYLEILLRKNKENDGLIMFSPSTQKWKLMTTEDFFLP